MPSSHRCHLSNGTPDTPMHVLCVIVIPGWMPSAARRFQERVAAAGRSHETADFDPLDDVTRCEAARGSADGRQASGSNDPMRSASCSRFQGESSEVATPDAAHSDGCESGHGGRVGCTASSGSVWWATAVANRSRSSSAFDRNAHAGHLESAFESGMNILPAAQDARDRVVQAGS